MTNQEHLSDADSDWLLLTPHNPRALRWMAQIFLIASLVYAIPSIWLYMNYMQPAFDLGLYDQSLWLITRGEWFNTVGGFHVLGVHFSPILILVSPIALVPGGAVPELILQATLIASGEPWFSLMVLAGTGQHARRLGREPEHVQAFGPKQLTALLEPHFAVVSVGTCLPWLVAKVSNGR